MTLRITLNLAVGAQVGAFATPYPRVPCGLENKVDRVRVTCPSPSYSADAPVKITSISLLEVRQESKQEARGRPLLMRELSVCFF